MEGVVNKSFELLNKYGIKISCDHNNNDNDTIPSKIIIKAILIFDYCYEPMICYRTNGRRLVSKRKIPIIPNYGHTYNPFCFSCRASLSYNLFVSNKHVPKSQVMKKVNDIREKIWNIATSMELTDGIYYTFELLNHGIVRIGPERVCNEEEFEEWIADGNDGDVEEEEIPLINGLERVDIDHEDDNNGELLQRECGICLQSFKIMEIKEDDYESLKVDDNVATDVGAITKPLVKLPCKHVFHETCVLRWLHTNYVCPFCRFDLSQLDVSDDSYDVSDFDDDSDDDSDDVTDDSDDVSDFDDDSDDDSDVVSDFDDDSSDDSVGRFACCNVGIFISLFFAQVFRF